MPVCPHAKDARHRAEAPRPPVSETPGSHPSDRGGGLSIVAACERAGMSRQGYHKAMKRAEVRDHLRVVQQDFIETADAKRAYLKARAFEVALDLMLNSKSEAIRARMVELLASNANVSPVAVHIDARQPGPGYVYKRPEQIDSKASVAVEAFFGMVCQALDREPGPASNRHNEVGLEQNGPRCHFFFDCRFAGMGRIDGNGIFRRSVKPRIRRPPSDRGRKAFSSGGACLCQCL